MPEITPESTKSPLELLRTGDLQVAWQIADRFEQSDSMLWNLLLAWVLADNGKLSQATATIDRLGEKNLPRLSNWQADYGAFLLGFLSNIDSETLNAVRQELLGDQNQQQYQPVAVKHQIQINDRNFSEDILDLIILVEEQTELALSQIKAGEKMAARDSWHHAVETDKSIQEPRQRTDLLRVIASAMAQAGDISCAIETVNLIEQPKLPVIELRAIISQIIETGEFVKAYRTTSLIDDPKQRADALLEIAAAQVEAENTYAAQTTISSGLQTPPLLQNQAIQEWALGEILSVPSFVEKLGIYQISSNKVQKKHHFAI